MLSILFPLLILIGIFEYLRDSLVKEILGVFGLWEASETSGGLVILFYHSKIILIALQLWT
ncbi:hypothetical protein Lalb_Chr25g0281431 [Lupinus albus]|uniref:Uncharacterized protein n=1 Tax=Lupinus albus TaxID=3870 RepID=A0A6A4MKF3_LUPAL|nr:hypothetical protein Lalb_Chr25g0281431 [Lupinus albus]